jgi:hypothetical protein
MGDRSGAADGAISYYAVRATLSRLTTDLVTSLAQRGTADASAPVVARLVAEVVGRFGFVVSERAAATAVPVLGALGGATLNVVFMDHFERIATGHFTVRRLERRYGPETVALCYQQAARRLRLARRWQRPGFSNRLRFRWRSPMVQPCPAASWATGSRRTWSVCSRATRTRALTPQRRATRLPSPVRKTCPHR